MIELSERKALLRKESMSRRKRAAADAPNAAFRAARNFMNAIEPRPTEVVSLYRTIRTEIDSRPLIEALWKKGVRTCFPVVIGAGQPLEFREADSTTVFVAGSFGAMIPDTSARTVTPTIVVAPLLAFDRGVYRLGYGGGFYDRTLQKLRSEGSVRAYGYAYAAQEIEEVPTEPTDQRLDGCITEEGFIRPRD